MAKEIVLRPLVDSGNGAWRTFDAETDPLGTWAAALAVEPSHESLLTWTGVWACAVDVDVAETGHGFDDAALVVLLDDFEPRPFAAWTTHGHGLRLMYLEQDGFPADEIAAVALMNLLERVDCAGVELKRSTRHPLCEDSRGRCCGQVFRREQRFDERSLRRRLRLWTAADAEARAWLEERGMEPGGRYPHTQCPVDPSDRGGRNPVTAGDVGMFCFVCEAAGTRAGSSRAGFFPYSHLVGGRGRTSTMLYRCLENATHWEHARFVMEEELGASDSHARLVYSAGVALLRGRPAAERCFVVGRDFVRLGDRWTNLNGEPWSKDVKPVLGTLPACGRWDDHGKFVVDRARVALFEQPFDLAPYGYPSLVPTFGCRTWDGPTSGVRAVVQTRELSEDQAAPLRPRVGPKIETMWHEFELVLPGLSRELLLLLVSARVFSERGDGMPPMVFVTGPTGASKSMTAHLAASVCGDRCTEVVWTSDSVRLRQAVASAKAVGTYCAFNEVLKEARREPKRGMFAMDFVLNLTPDSVSHEMYTGPVRLGNLPVFVWTDTDLPGQLKQDAQLARRVVHAGLSTAVLWEAPLRRAGIGHPKAFRSSSEARARAADSVLAEAVAVAGRDRSFQEAAAELGFGLLAESEEAEEGRDSLRELFEAACAAPEAADSDAQRWKGRGWKVFMRDHASRLRDAWTAVADADNFGSSRQAAEVDWQKVCGLAEPAQVEVRAHGQRLALRFKSARGTRSTYKVNDELRKRGGT